MNTRVHDRFFKHLTPGALLIAALLPAQPARAQDQPAASPADSAPAPAPAVVLGLPREPVDIGHEPQFVFDLYHIGNDPAPCRRVARMSSRELWTDWMAAMEPQSIIDEIDPNDQGFNFSMAMPVRYHAGIYWGFLEPFPYSDYIWTEVVTSRDGVHFQHFDGRPRLVEFGEDGAWDDTIIMGGASWVEVGDEWWFYYNGWDGEHGVSAAGTVDRTGHLGLATLRKEGLVSMRAPAAGGMMVTRRIAWPGGGLTVNVDASKGEFKVRASDAARIPIAGFDFDDCETFKGDRVAHEVRWGGRSLNELKGRVIRLEFQLANADFYTFCAGGTGGRK